MGGCNKKLDRGKAMSGLHLSKIKTQIDLHVHECFCQFTVIKDVYILQLEKVESTL